MSDRAASPPGPAEPCEEAARLALQAKAVELLLCAAAAFACQQPEPAGAVWMLLVTKDAGFLLTTRPWPEVELNLGPEQFAAVQAEAAAPCAPEERRVLVLRECACGGKHCKLLTVGAVPFAIPAAPEVPN